MKFVFCLFALFVIVNGATFQINNDIINLKVVRKIDVSTHLVKITSEVLISNNGQNSVNSYLVAIDPQLAKNLAFIGAVLSGKDESEPLSVTETSVEKKSEKFFLVHLNQDSISSGSEKKIEIETIFTHSLLPFPAEITQSEKQFVKFIGNLYFFSPYRTKTQTTSVLCSSSNIDSYTKEKPYNLKDKTVTYGPHENVEPFKESTISLHYENNSPFLTVTRMTRLIEVSHWGNIAVEETFEVKHSGAKLKGPFSRYDYQRNMDGVSSIKSFKTLLPLSSKDIYYRDEIGNISTSAIKEVDAGLELELKPRFPLFGGWKTQHVVGYNVPSYQFLYNKGNNFALVMKLIDHIYDNQVVDEFNLKIILPEKVSNVDIKPPYPVTRGADALHHTYLDTSGRMVLQVSKNNLVEHHIQDFQLFYTFSKPSLLQEPLLVFGAFFILFLSIILYVRMDFSISKDESTENRLRLGGLMKQAADLHERRSSLYQTYEDALNKFKASKDSNLFKNSQRKIEQDHKQISTQITSLQNKLKSEGADYNDKIIELNKLDSQVRNIITQMITNTERFLAGRMQKQQFMDAEGHLKTQKSDLLGSIDHILSSF